MKLVTIYQPNHEVLRTPAKEVLFPLSEEIKKIILDMRRFILNDLQGEPAGLAATQVDHPWKIVYIQIPENIKEYRKDAMDVVPLSVLINPTYEPILEEGKVKDWEACYSVPNMMGEVYRYHAIRCCWYDEAGKKHERLTRGFLARLLQHEIGHLNTEVYVDLITPDCRFGTVEEMSALQEKERAL